MTAMRRGCMEGPIQKRSGRGAEILMWAAPKDSKFTNLVLNHNDDPSRGVTAWNHLTSVSHCHDQYATLVLVGYNSRSLIA